mmetsp:Transcript_79375/g.171555  ORF Transcript_79375/g.171555 Transcript_79375/m.171555 type:complete len:111 (-) Transcript_79375:945-1277(-)
MESDIKKLQEARREAASSLEGVKELFNHKLDEFHNKLNIISMKQTQASQNPLPSSNQLSGRSPDTDLGGKELKELARLMTDVGNLKAELSNTASEVRQLRQDMENSLNTL